MSGTIPKFLSKYMQHVRTNNNFDKFMEKVKIISAGQGALKAEFKMDTEHLNIFGEMHGGFSVTMVDVLSAWALYTHKDGGNDSVSVNINVTYIKGAKVGNEVLIDAKTLKVGKSLAFLDVEIRNKVTNDLLVHGSHTKFMLPSKIL